jgi:hypothetical protein
VNQEKTETKREVCLEETEVDALKALKGSYEDWRLVIRCCGQPKKWIQGSGGSWHKLATSRDQLTHHAIPALHKGCGRREPGKTPSNASEDEAGNISSI